MKNPGSLEKKARFIRLIIFDMGSTKKEPLKLIQTQCCICESGDVETVGVGKDFEYDTSPDTFSAVRCHSCGLVFLNPRPDISEFEKIYPANYHAFNFSEKQFGIVYKIRSWLESKRLLKWCKSLPEDARILDVGCGDGFHLKLLREYGKKSWRPEGIDLDERAVEMARKSGLIVHRGNVESIDLPPGSYDLAYIVQTIEHVENPVEVLLGIRRLLKPGGKLVIVTDNTDSIDFGFFKKNYWGGYHFPRHWNLFNKNSMRKLAEKINFEVEVLESEVSPVNWVYSIHNWLVGKKAPNWLINRFTLGSPVSLSVFTMLDIILQTMKRGALLHVILKKPS
ncbi:MAG: methyltransferase domain-containing protein [Ginsengibacter sp.]